MDKLIHQELTIFEDNAIKLYDVNYDPVELYRFILQIKSNYRIKREFSFETKKVTDDYNVARAADVDKVLKCEYNPVESGYEISGVGMLKSRIEKIIGMRGNLKGQEIYFEKLVETLPALSMYLKDPVGGDDILPIEKKIEVVSKYFDIHNFDFKDSYDQFDDQIKFIYDYIGEVHDDDIDKIFDIAKARAKDNTDFLNAIDRKGVKVLQKLR